MVVRSPQQTVVQQSSIQYATLRCVGRPKIEHAADGLKCDKCVTGGLNNEFCVLLGAKQPKLTELASVGKPLASSQKNRVRLTTAVRRVDTSCKISADALERIARAEAGLRRPFTNCWGSPDAIGAAQATNKVP